MLKSQLYIMANYCLWTIIVFIVSSCSSSFTLPNRNIDISFDKFEYFTSNDTELIFYAQGFLRNPNELSIRPINFTYQMSLDGKFYAKGLVRPTLREGKLYFKSNSPFRVPIQVKFADLGGIGQVIKRNSFLYEFSFRFYDERGNRSSLDHSGTVNLSALVHEPYFNEVRVTPKEADVLEIHFSLINSNNFELPLQECSYQLLTATATVEQKINLPWAVIEENTEERLRISAPGTVTLSEPFRFIGTCLIENQSFSNEVSGIVR